MSEKAIASESQQRFNQYWMPEPYSSCWLWIGATKNGYGELNFHGEVLYCHRLSWELHRGEIPIGKLVCHTCNTRRCVNPSHLYLGDKRSNSFDAVRDGGIKTKITAKIADEIRKATETQREIAKRYGLSQPTIGRIRRGVSWNHA